MSNPGARLARRGAQIFAWLSQAPRPALLLLAASLVLSFGLWALRDRSVTCALFFPASGGGLGTELRELPRAFGVERRAEVLAADFLLGPQEPGLLPPFQKRVGLKRVLYRSGTLYLDLAEDAALLPADSLAAGVAALRKTVKLALRAPRALVVTVGGRELDGAFSAEITEAQAKKD